MMMKTTTKTTCCLVLVALMLLVDSSVAARKLLPKRPVKPLKTFPRNNATPIPAAGALAAAAAVGAAATATATATATAGAGTLNGSELPKPLTLQSDEPAEAIVASPPGAASASAAASASESALASVAASPANVETKADDLANQTPTATPSGSGLIDEDCEPDMIGFELITGYVLSAPSRQLETLPGTLMLTDCLEACQANESCSSVNYETGLCVMFRSTADQLPGSLSRSQYPVFTVYAQKSCFGVRPCSKAWCIDRVQGYRLPERAKASQSVATRRDCIELCLGETEFTCRSANYYAHSGLCELSDMDRITLSDEANIAAYDGADYLENNCAEEPSKLCEFKRISGRILKTVDSVHQNVQSIDDCRDLCLTAPFRCHSYDYNETGEHVCRLSHHSRATLTDLSEPYLSIEEAATYEQSACYNVSIDCRSGEMITKIRTSKLFDGKVYAKGAPKSCAVNVNNSLEFDLKMRYNDLECNVRQSAYGRYMNDIVIQHHDMIVTSFRSGTGRLLPV
ncbi:GL27254 [Drosophila persimilis]|uniref:GL27254 n=1 Tax=Drosophila persimilis TaxID=7234 RepID=B4GYU7_DROPE|nr:GL27254 [Drosophila persimilis]